MKVNMLLLVLSLFFPVHQMEVVAHQWWSNCNCNSMSAHHQGTVAEDEEDPIIKKLEKTGCLEKHYAVLVAFWPFIYSFCPLRK